jgi:two-component system response regulator AtoC
MLYNIACRNHQIQYYMFSTSSFFKGNSDKNESKPAPIENQNQEPSVPSTPIINAGGMIKVFIVEDDAFFGKAIQFTLEKEQDYDVTLFTNGADLIKNLHGNPDIVVIDYNLPDMTGLEILQRVKTYNEEIVPIILSGQNEVEVVVKAYKIGAKDYILKNANAHVELVNSVKTLGASVKLKRQVEVLQEQIIDRQKYSKIIGESKALLSVLKMIQKVEKSNMLVMINGQNGTGKEGIASAIHYNSPRARGTYVTVNMASVPIDLAESELFGHEKGAFTGADNRRIGKFEEANGGSIFLDEIGEMDLGLQAKLLRVLQENVITRVGSNREIPIDVRVIAATNRNLAEMAKEGKFREDLYYRLQGFLIKLPPLKDRGNDILLLANSFLTQFASHNKLGNKSISKEAKELLLKHEWPGNVRELKATIERAALMSDGDVITEEDILFA